MKSAIFLIGIAMIFYGCKDETQSVENLQVNDMVSEKDYTLQSMEGITTIGGEFIYFADAAVLQTSTGMYGVVIDKKMHELNDLVQPYKKEDTDFVPVTVRGLIIPKEEGAEGWDYNIAIKEIIKVEKPNPNKEDVIKLGTN